MYKILFIFCMVHGSLLSMEGQDTDLKEALSLHRFPLKRPVAVKATFQSPLLSKLSKKSSQEKLSELMHGTESTLSHAERVIAEIELEKQKKIINKRKLDKQLEKDGYAIGYGIIIDINLPKPLIFRSIIK